IQSVCKRFSDASHASIKCLRLKPRALGSFWSCGKNAFVASTTDARRPARALPTNCSLAPAEYAFAVSTKFTPRSSAACVMAMESCSFALRPNIIVPRHNELTLTPVRPRLRYSMRLLRRPSRRCRRDYIDVRLAVADEVAFADR